MMHTQCEGDRLLRPVGLCDDSLGSIYADV
jgi:hypothetical protein